MRGTKNATLNGSASVGPLAYLLDKIEQATRDGASRAAINALHIQARATMKAIPDLQDEILNEAPATLLPA